MIVVIESPTEREHLRRALEQYAYRVGRTSTPDALLDALDALSRHPTPHPATAVENPDEPGDDELMTYRQAADAAGVSKRTISRWVADGRLGPIGRRLPRADVLDLIRGER